MLVSLIEGPDSLEEVNQPKTTKTGKKVNMKVIQCKQNEGRRGFKIGHDGARSETFLPNFQML